MRKQKSNANANIMNKKVVAAVSAVIAILLIACGILIIDNIRMRNLVESGDGVFTSDGTVDISAFEGMTETRDVQRYAAEFVNADGEAFLYYIFGFAEDVFVYDETYEGEIITEVTKTWSCESDYTKYLFQMEYGELYFERGDLNEAASPGVTALQAESLIAEVMALHGLPAGNLVFGGEAAGVFVNERKGTYYFAVRPVDGLNMSVYSAGVYAVVQKGDIISFSYKNIADEQTAIGAPVTIISAAEASLRIAETPEEDFSGMDSLTFTKAELVYDVFRVYGHPDKAVLSPVWEFSTADEFVFQVDAVTGEPLGGGIPAAFTIEEWNGDIGDGI